MMKKLVSLCVALAVGSIAFAQNHVETVTMTIAPGEYATLPLTYVRLDVVLKASLKFKKFEGVEIGCGRNVYCGGWLSITPNEYTNIWLNTHRNEAGRYVMDTTVVATEHWNDKAIRKGLDITIVSRKTGTDMEIRNGRRCYNGHLSRWWSGGEPFVKNLGTQPLTVELSFERLKAGEPVWFYADSYFSTNNNLRWPYYMYNEGYDHWMGDHLPGAGSHTMLECFKHDLEVDTPKMAVWMLGMNDSSDVDGEPNPNWLRCVTEFISICKEKGIEPVLTTVPTVPERQHDAKTKWVRESGCRYIDWYEAVGTDSKGNWTEGYLYKDLVHPAAPGAEALWKAVHNAIPELE